MQPKHLRKHAQTHCWHKHGGKIYNPEEKLAATIYFIVTMMLVRIFCKFFPLPIQRSLNDSTMRGSSLKHQGPPFLLQLAVLNQNSAVLNQNVIEITPVSPISILLIIDWTPLPAKPWKNSANHHTCGVSCIAARAQAGTILGFRVILISLG